MEVIKLMVDLDMIFPDLYVKLHSLFELIGHD